MTRLWVILIVLFLASRLEAQTACVVPTAPASISSAVPVVVYGCVLQSDNVTGLNVYGLPAGMLPVNGLAPVGSVYGDGKRLLKGTLPAQPRGSYTVTIKPVNLSIPGDPTTTQEGPSSSPFPYTFVDPVAAPIAVSSWTLSNK